MDINGHLLTLFFSNASENVNLNIRHFGIFQYLC